MVLNTIFLGSEISKGVGDFVTQKLDEADIQRFAEGLEKPEVIIGKKQAQLAKKLNIPSHFLINEPTEALERRGFFV